MFEVLDEKGQSEWSSVYLILVLAIAALLLIAVVKPMFRQSQKIVAQAIPDSGMAGAGGGSFGNTGSAGG